MSSSPSVQTHDSAGFLQTLGEVHANILVDKILEVAFLTWGPEPTNEFEELLKKQKELSTYCEMLGVHEGQAFALIAEGLKEGSGGSAERTDKIFEEFFFRNNNGEK